MRFRLEGDSGGVRVRMHFEQHRRRWLAVRIMLGILAFTGLTIGLWAVLAPQSWYNSFPGFGMHWVSVDGPYNHHLVGDVGGFFLALGAISAFALWRGGAALAQAAGIGWLVLSVPHTIYHVSHKPAELGSVSYTLSLLAVLALFGLGLACLLVPPRGAQVPDPEPIEFRFPRRRGSR
ncbi:hypothetical protein AB0H76_30635 [Nocardia sp. NPDC050712]|uniref:hypothetical protein n=1 Tax=Nocardia sp. NPDC050712 TaxID=3155518 RepID=UPI00340CEE95